MKILSGRRALGCDKHQFRDQNDGEYLTRYRFTIDNTVSLPHTFAFSHGLAVFREAFGVVVVYIIYDIS